jgi:hypothetical protein
MRHKVNIHLEDFRLCLQQTLTREFAEFSSTVHTQQLLPAKCGRYENDGGYAEGTGSTGSLESHRGEASIEKGCGVTGESADHTRQEYPAP